MGLFFNWSKGDIGFSFSDKFGLDQEGNLQHKISDHLSLDLSSGDINFISGWKDREENDKHNN